MSLANWFSTIFCIFTRSFPNSHLFLINSNVLRTFSTHFYSYSFRFGSAFSTSLSVVSICSWNCFTPIYSFINFFHILVLALGQYAISNINQTYFYLFLTKLIWDFYLAPVVVKYRKPYRNQSALVSSGNNRDICKS